MSSIKGIDISNNDGSVDCSAIAASGVQYVYVKATEGNSFKDGFMDEFYQGCKANGLKVGPYHFLTEGSTPESQAENFYAKIKDYDWDLVPMMDIETAFSSKSLPDYIRRFVAAFNSLSPLQLGVYSYTSFIEEISGASDVIANLPFWEANYNNNPWNLPSNSVFTNRIGHQYSETGSQSGVNTDCDLNVFTEGVLINSNTIPGTWQLQDSKWWYKHEDGSYTKNGWEHINGQWYSFDSDGYMIYSWKKDGNNWYYLGGSSDGAMKYGWVLTNSKWYYFGTKDDGAMKTGWQQIDGKWYFFDQSGAMQTGWVLYENKNYCMYSDGSMITNCDLYGYRFDTSGVATKL